MAGFSGYNIYLSAQPSSYDLQFLGPPLPFLLPQNIDYAQRCIRTQVVVFEQPASQDTDGGEETENN